MPVRLSDDLLIAFSGSSYGFFRKYVYELIKTIEYMTLREFRKNYAGKEFIEIKADGKTAKVYFKLTDVMVYIDSVVVS
jgi:hypothetical protein